MLLQNLFFDGKSGMIWSLSQQQQQAKPTNYRRQTLRVQLPEARVFISVSLRAAWSSALAFGSGRCCRILFSGRVFSLEMTREPPNSLVTAGPQTGDERADSRPSSRGIWVRFPGSVKRGFVQPRRQKPLSKLR